MKYMQALTLAVLVALPFSFQIDEFTDRPFSLQAAYFLEAHINGEPWKAVEMILDQDNSSIVEVKGRNGDSFISFSLYRPAAGKEKKFSSTSPAIWSNDTRMEIYSSEQGSAKITRIDQGSIEGIFTFTAILGEKKVVVSDGRFKIPNPLQ